MNDTTVDDLLERGKLLALQDRTEEAEQALHDALRASRGSSLLESRASCGLGTLYARDGRHFEAIMLYRARWSDAGVLGLRRVYTDVEPDSASHRHCGRAGFREVAVLTLWCSGTAG